MVPRYTQLEALSPTEFFMWSLTVPAPAVRLGFALRGDDVCLPSLALNFRATATGPELLRCLVRPDGSRLFRALEEPEAVLTEPTARALNQALPEALRAMEPGDAGRARLRAGAREADLLGAVLGRLEPKELPEFFGLALVNLTRLHWEAWFAASKVYNS